VLDCIILGDSIAVGLGQARPDCVVFAVSGISSERYLQVFPTTAEARIAIISLGVNDGEGAATADNLRLLRRKVTASTIYWLVAGSNPAIRAAVHTVAGEFADRLIDVAPLAGPDHIHPDRAGYAALAAQTGGAPAQTPPAAAAFAEFPGLKIWNGPYNLNGVPTKGR
jgi:lysophospholipase L1-like esterase